eukprot:CAMPEP_0195528604 /NCGR_PEP_ID=MMETSP0794_2-20130614/30821_1 /TAXON_ID=515487 /ORGANISM="Stephanopyxis turris, Strain CCMP 815" /LENGTH=50 /DNA_ID=CAMNT_0040659767 /DNA_START=223 /DNA_END=372 /DNA_ORIENTATION=-
MAKEPRRTYSSGTSREIIPLTAAERGRYRDKGDARLDSGDLLSPEPPWKP